MSLASRGRVADLFQTALTEAPAWVGQGILPKSGILLCGGPAKIGKTFLGLEAADNLTQGTALWSTFPVTQSARVLYIDQEVGTYGFHKRIAERYTNVGYYPSPNFFYATKVAGLELDKESGQRLLAREIEDTGAQVVILDPISKCMSGDENSNTDVNRLFVKLMELQAHYKDLSFILMHHFGKPPKDAETLENWDPFSPYNFRGASKWYDAPDTLMMLQRMPGKDAGEWWRLRTKLELRQAEELAEQPTFAVCHGGRVVPVTHHKLELQPFPTRPLKPGPLKNWGSG